MDTKNEQLSVLARYGTLALFLLVVIGAGSAIGIATAPGEWYDGLAKPPFNPPNWIFAPVWTFLYICIAMAGWRIWQRDRSGLPMRLWWGQLALNWLWSPVFFTLHLLWPAFGIILLMAMAIAAFIATARRVDVVSSILFAPYLAWVAFAGLLNLSVAILN